jgi:CRP/FNR family transcriptional regulator, cyclic AMP receptor protein
MSDLAHPVNPFLRSSEGRAPEGELLVIPQWTEAAWQQLFSYAHAVGMPAGSLLIQPGVSDRALFFVMSGSLDIVSRIGDHSLGTIAAVKPGSVVGEVAFFDDNPRSAKVWATKDSDLLRLDYADYQRYLAAHPARAAELTFALGRLMALRLRRTMMQAARSS